MRVGAFHPSNLAVFVKKLLGAAVIDKQGAVLRCGARYGQGQAGVVKLAVPVFDAAAQAMGLGGGQELLGLGAVEQFGLAQAGFACELVVQRQAQAVKRRLPPAVAGHDKGERLGDMGRAVQHRGALAQGLAHQRNIALGQVAHAAVHQLGGSRRRAFGKVLRLYQHHLQAARRGVERHTQARGAAAYNRQVVARARSQAGEQIVALGGQGRGVGKVGGHVFGRKRPA